MNWAMADLFYYGRSGVCHLDEMRECEGVCRYSSSPHQPVEEQNWRDWSSAKIHRHV